MPLHADTVDITVQDTTPPQVAITSPQHGGIYTNTQGTIPVEYTATDACDETLDIVVQLGGVELTDGEIDLCGMVSGEYVLTVTTTDDSGNTGVASARFMVEPQSLETFVTKYMTINWASRTADRFRIVGTLQLPDGYAVADLEESVTVTIAMAHGLGNDTVAFAEWTVENQGAIWNYWGGEQPPGQGMNITNMNILWPSQSGYRAGQAGFLVSGVLELPEDIGKDTRPAEAMVTMEIPVSVEVGCGSLLGTDTLEFRVSKWRNRCSYPSW